MIVIIHKSLAKVFFDTGFFIKLSIPESKAYSKVSSSSNNNSNVSKPHQQPALSNENKQSQPKQSDSQGIYLCINFIKY